MLHNLCTDLNQPVPAGEGPVPTDHGLIYDDDPFEQGENFVFDGYEVRQAIVERFK